MTNKMEKKRQTAQQKAMKKFYSAINGSITKLRENAQVYGECLDKIAQKKGGSVKPIDIVEEAEKSNSPLHDFFDWDNKLASDKWRLNQARYLMNHITVVVKYDNKVKEEKAFFSVSVNHTNEDDVEEKRTAYVTLDRVQSETELRVQVIENALQELQYWQEKYSTYKELFGVFRAINKMSKKVLNKITKKASKTNKKTNKKAKSK